MLICGKDLKKCMAYWPREMQSGEDVQSSYNNNFEGVINLFKEFVKWEIKLHNIQKCNLSNQCHFSNFYMNKITP